MRRLTKLKIKEENGYSDPIDIGVGQTTENKTYVLNVNGTNVSRSGSSASQIFNYSSNKAMSGGHAEGQSTQAFGATSHTEGYGTKAWGANGHAEGQQTQASGSDSHAQGYTTAARGFAAHAQGYTTTASGAESHAQGNLTTASGAESHAQGNLTTASGAESHAQGNLTTASGTGAHAEGIQTIAASNYQHVQGKYNIMDSNDKYAHIIGNGYKQLNNVVNSNAETIDWNGVMWLASDIRCGGDDMDDSLAISLVDLATRVAALENLLNT